MKTTAVFYRIGSQIFTLQVNQVSFKFSEQIWQWHHLSPSSCEKIDILSALHVLKNVQEGRGGGVHLRKSEMARLVQQR